jgi:tRNA 2-selenouridine synthase
MSLFVESQQYSELLLSGRVIVDVRAPAEFAEGSLPGSINLPILDDTERALIGTCYKKKGPSAAVQLGYELVSGANREKKIHDWVSYFRTDPDAVLTCFRGGQRSRIAQEWLKEAGISAPRIQGGTKAIRSFLMEQIAVFSQNRAFTLISGPTGSGKTHFLRACAEFSAFVDLEELAHHKGSAFGKEDRPQPTQVDFENRLALQLMRQEERLRNQRGLFFLVEDESRMIGSCSQPGVFFEKLRQSPVIWLEVSLPERVQNIFKDYVLETPIGAGDFERGQKIFDRYKEALSRIQKRLGGLRYVEILKDLEHCQHEFIAAKANQNSSEKCSEKNSEKNGQALASHLVWIEKLLVYYYDPLYNRSLEMRQPEVFFRGSPESALDLVKAGLHAGHDKIITSPVKL